MSDRLSVRTPERAAPPEKNAEIGMPDAKTAKTMIVIGPRRAAANTSPR